MRLRALLTVLLALCFVASAKKKPELTIRFHSEIVGGNSDTFAVPIMFSYPPHQGIVSKIPDFSERNIVEIYPFQAADGSMGCAFKLDQHGTLALDTLSVDKRGRSIVVMLNGRHVIDMVIDRRVSDGIITVQRGLTPAEVGLLQKEFPLFGQKAGKKKR